LRVFPVFIDDRPEYLASSPPLSLLLMPVGAENGLSRLRAEVARHSRHRIAVVTRFEPGRPYLAALAALGVRAEDVYTEAAFVERLGRYEPSDWLLVRDARRLGARPLELGRLLAEPPLSARFSRHLVCRAGAAAGTNERLLLDTSGRVSRIQRYYENVTWPFASGVACSLIQAAGAVGSPRLAVTHLAELRAALSAAGVASTDFDADAAVFDLSTEAGFLAANEASISASRSTPHPPSAVIDPGAHLRGAIVVGVDVVVEDQAIVIGPCVLGQGSRVGRGAVVAQCVVAPGAAVPAGEIARQRVVTRWRAISAAHAGDFEVLGAEGLTLSRPLDREQNPSTDPDPQRMVEAALSFFALLALSPLLGLIALLVKLDSKGPIFYGDPREGRFGRVFRCWKFRTMRMDADVAQQELAEANQVDGPQFKIHRDPRVTRVGRWLRRLNLDEIPQLWNVLAGEMSLVGPRPSPFRENQLCIPWREGRLSVRPGITGLWQLCRQDRSSGDFHQWIYYDLLYVQHRSSWLDLKILVATVTSLAGHFPVPLSRLLPPEKFHDRRQTPRLPTEGTDAASLRRTA
jgi:lipopolysaccharide/colanic/teichoic acid biosynthesis glycosyltransferase